VIDVIEFGVIMDLVSLMPLAELPAPGGYISILKLVFVLVWFVLWLLFCQWVDQDTQYVKAMPRYLWNAVILGSGTFAMAIWLLLPWQGGLFAAGWGIWFVLTAGACAIYVALRNRLVDPGARVFTPRHIAAQLSKLGAKKGKGGDVVERVSVTGVDGKKVKPPEDPAHLQPYETVQNLLFDALWRRATDVAMAGDGQNVRLIYRIDGVAVERRDLIAPPQVGGAIEYLKQIAGLNREERRKPQSGKITAVNPTAGGTKVEVEVKTSGTKAGERLDLRIMTQESRLRLPDLGMADQQLEQFEKIVKTSSGLVIVSGPRASGVTTTLYAALRAHDAFMQNLQSLERAPLMDLENITQNRFDPTRADVTYARQLQSILRREPDVVMVSDCPDPETAHLAARAAVDGKKIYVGIQARNSIDALNRFVHLCNDRDVASAAIKGITCQRLIRKLCVSCREPYKPDAALLRKANIPADHVEYFYRARTEPLLDKKGKPILCPNCQGSGHFGRIGVFEVLTPDDVIRELIKNGQPSSSIVKQARKNGMRELQDIGIQLVVKGVTSMNEVIRGLRDEEPPPPGVAPVVPKPEK
jgi:general secretion pathway protein E